MRWITIAIATMLLASQVAAQSFTDAVISEYQNQGFSRVEVKNGPTQTKVEAIRGRQKVEVVYDRQTGAILEQEVERVRRGENIAPGIEVSQRARDFVNHGRTVRDEARARGRDDNRGRGRGRGADDDDDDDDRGRGRGRGRGGDNDSDDDDGRGRGGDDDSDDDDGRGRGGDDDSDDDGGRGRGGDDDSGRDRGRDNDDGGRGRGRGGRG